jgi:hypothetical protein
MRTYLVSTLVICTAGLLGCGVEPPSASGPVETVGSEEAEIQLNGTRWDGADGTFRTSCPNFPGAHCCPMSGWAMNGAHLDQDVLRCGFTPGINYGNCTFNHGVLRNGVAHSCSNANFTMVGYRASTQDVYCCESRTQLHGPFEDGPGHVFGVGTFTKNGQQFSAHMCTQFGSGTVQIGLDSTTNEFLCSE